MNPYISAPKNLLYFSLLLLSFYIQESISSHIRILPRQGVFLVPVVYSLDNIGTQFFPVHRFSHFTQMLIKSLCRYFPFYHIRNFRYIPPVRIIDVSCAYLLISRFSMLYHISQQQSSDDHQYYHQDSSFYYKAVLFLRGLSVRFLCLSFLRFWIR